MWSGKLVRNLHLQQISEGSTFLVTAIFSAKQPAA
jgi:hypothetical protein